MARLDIQTGSSNNPIFSIDKILTESATKHSSVSNKEYSTIYNTREYQLLDLDDNLFTEPVDSYDDLFNMYFENFSSMKHLSFDNEWVEKDSNYSIEGLNSYLML